MGWQSLGGWSDPDYFADAGTTVVQEVSYAQVAAVGMSEAFAREDHTHGTPDTPASPYGLVAMFSLM